MVENLSDKQIQEEIANAEFLIEIILMFYKQEKGSYNERRNA